MLLLCTSVLWEGVEPYSRLGTYYLFLPSGWALIRGWALYRINTVTCKQLVTSETRPFLDRMSVFLKLFSDISVVFASLSSTNISELEDVDNNTRFGHL